MNSTGAEAGLYAQVEGRRIAALIGIWLLFAAWQILFTPQFASLVFGIGGGLIMLLFLGVIWNWVRARPTLSGSQKLGADVQMIGFAFLVTAAWHICGLMGPPAFALMDAQQMVTGGVVQASSLMAELVLGWAFVFASQRVALRKKAVGASDVRPAVATD